MPSRFGRYWPAQRIGQNRRCLFQGMGKRLVSVRKSFTEIGRISWRRNDKNKPKALLAIHSSSGFCVDRSSSASPDCRDCVCLSVNPTGGMSYEPALVYFGIAILFLALAPGRFSLDKKIFGERTGTIKPLT